LPHSDEAERAVVAAILLESPGWEAQVTRPEARDFFRTAHRTIYRRLKQLVQEPKKPDIILLIDSLGTHGELEGVGGSANISALLDGMPRVCNLPYYVDVIKDKAHLRQQLSILQDLLDMGFSANGNAREVSQEIAAHSAHLREEVGQKRILSFLTGVEFAAATGDEVDWLIPGYSARGVITEWGGKVKTGKTTAILIAVRCLAQGISFLGRPTAKTATVYLTEQNMVSFRQAMKRADLDGRHDFFVLTHCETRGMKWTEVASAAVTKCKESQAGLLVVDTLPQFAGIKGDEENNSGAALEAMEPLQLAAAEGIGVIVVRHERKSGGDVGESGRGSSAFAGVVDVVISLRKPEGHSRKTVRLLQALSRFSETPAELLIELTHDGYVSLGEPHDAALKEAKDAIFKTAPAAELEALDLKELVATADVPRATAQRAVEELVKQGMLSRIGKGKKGDPFRYFLPEKPFCPTSNIEEQKSGNQDPSFWPDKFEAI
jgi:hypothetical protein